MMAPEQPTGAEARLPDDLRYWVNALPYAECLLVSVVWGQLPSCVCLHTLRNLKTLRLRAARDLKHTHRWRHWATWRGDMAPC